jgi:hypothetical protein
VSFHIGDGFANSKAQSRFAYYSIGGTPSNVYDGGYQSDYYFNEGKLNSSGVRSVHRIAMYLSKSIEVSTLSFTGNVTNLESYSFNGFILVFVIENGLIDPNYPQITWNFVFRDYGLNKTLSLAGFFTESFEGTWSIPNSANKTNIGVVAAVYDADSRDPTYGRPYAVQSTCDVCGSEGAAQPPAPVTLNRPLNVTENSMKLSWTQNTNDNFAQYQIYQSISVEKLGTNIQNITIRSTTNLAVNGLSPDTTYYFRVRVVDADGLYADSNQVNATTLKEILPPTVSVTVNPTKLDTTQRIVFTVTAKDQGGSGIANVTLYIDDAPAKIWTTAGIYNYTGGPYTEGTHTYYATAWDLTGNKCRDPSSGYKNFTVSLPPQPPQLWPVLTAAVVLMSLVGAIFFLARKKK